jgi:hypothetical protein
LTSGKPNASLLEQFGTRKLATRRKLSTDHPDKPQVGSDESLPSQCSLVFEKSQLLVRRVCEAGARYSRITCQQASLYGALQLDNFGVCKQRFIGRVVKNPGHADTLREPLPIATAMTRNLWITRLGRRPPFARRITASKQSILSADAAGMQRFATCLQHHQFRKHLVVLVLFLNGIRALQLGLQRRNRTHDRQQMERC